MKCKVTMTTSFELNAEETDLLISLLDKLKQRSVPTPAQFARYVN